MKEIFIFTYILFLVFVLIFKRCKIFLWKEYQKKLFVIFIYLLKLKTQKEGKREREFMSASSLTR